MYVFLISGSIELINYDIIMVFFASHVSMRTAPFCGLDVDMVTYPIFLNP